MYNLIGVIKSCSRKYFFFILVYTKDGAKLITRAYQISELKKH